MSTEIMFESVQHYGRDVRIKAQNRDFDCGTGFMIKRDVKTKFTFTYKEISLIFGIVVAILITLTLWIMPSRSNGESSKTNDLGQSVLPFVQSFPAKLPAEIISIH